MTDLGLSGVGGHVVGSPLSDANVLFVGVLDDGCFSVKALRVRSFENVGKFFSKTP